MDGLAGGLEEANGVGRGRIVVIEDAAADRELLASVLGEYEYDVVECAPDEALARAAEAQPRLIVLSADVRGGFNLCLRFKKDPVLRRVPLLLATGKASPETIRKHRMLPTRADGYLLKPLSRESVLRSISELLPEDFQPVREESDVSDVRERTLVHKGALESAVVTYVEEEVRTLKEIVSRLEREKAQLQGRLTELEVDLRSEQSGLKALIETRKAEPPSDAIEEARRKGIEEGRAQALESLRSEMEQLRARAGEAEQLSARAAEAEALAAEVNKLQAARRATEEALAQARQEVAETTALFERLETGYKAQLDAAMAEKAAIEEAASRLEDEVAALREKASQMERQAGEILELRQAAARAEILNEECAGLRKQLEQANADLDAARAEAEGLRALARAAEELEGRIAELERDLAEARAAVEAAEKARDVARAESDSLKTKIATLRSLLAPELS